MTNDRFLSVTFSRVVVSVILQEGPDIDMYM